LRMPPLPADSIHARACKLKCEKILTRPALIRATFLLLNASVNSFWIRVVLPAPKKPEIKYISVIMFSFELLAPRPAQPGKQWF